MTGAVAPSMPSEGACTLYTQSLYSSTVSKTRGATGCQMPLSGMTSGALSSTSFSRPASRMGPT